MELRTNYSEYDAYDVAGNDFTKQFYKPPREADFEYNENNLPIGVTPDGEIATLSLKNAPRIIILGTTGSGKTFTLRGMTDRRYKIGYTVVNLTDVKNEMWSSNKPVQQKFAKSLLAGEEPCKTPIVVLRPTFYRQVSKELPPYNYWFSPYFSDMEKIDFMTMLGLDEKGASPAFKDVAEALFNCMKKDPSKYKSLQDVSDLINDIKDVSDKQRDKFRLKVSNMFESEFFVDGEDIIHDPIELSGEGYIVSFNHEGFDLFAKSGSGYPQVMVSMMLRKYIKARIAWLNKEKRAVEIKRLFLDGDEGNSFFPANKEPSSKYEAIDAVKKDRRYGVYLSFAYQSWNDIPEEIRKQSRYCLLPHNASIFDFMSAFEDFSTMRVDSTRRNRIREIQKKCKKVKHGWVILDRESGLHTIITPLAPMSYHMEMSK